MRLKKTALLFTFTILLLMLLLWYKNQQLSKDVVLFFKQIYTSQKNTLPGSKTDQKLSKIENVITERLLALETPKEEISTLHLLEDATIAIDATVPRGKPMEWILWSLTKAASKAGYYTADCQYQENPYLCTVTLAGSKKTDPTVKLSLSRSRHYFSSSAKMAIVINDFSFMADPTTSSFFAFPAPLTISLLVSKKMSVPSAEIAREHNKEIILLLPMEPLPRTYREFKKNAIMLHYPEDKIKNIIDESTKKIPFYTGFSNLCGSLVLNDSRVMTIILEAMREKNSYFLFIDTPNRSRVRAVAQKLQVPYQFTDIALGAETFTSSALSDTLRHAALIALKRGSVVLSASASPQLLEAATQMLPYFHQNGIQLVTVSEVINHPQP